MCAYTGSGSTKGKQAHMASAANEIAHNDQISVTRRSTLLIDDDLNNIQAALRNAVPAVHLNPADVIG